MKNENEYERNFTVYYDVFYKEYKNTNIKIILQNDIAKY